MLWALATVSLIRWAMLLITTPGFPVVAMMSMAVTAVVGAAENRLGNGDGFIGSTAEVHAVARAVIYAHHRVIGGVHSHALAARVTAAGKEILVNLFADDANLALLAHIHLVDVSAVKHFRRGNLGVIRIHALRAAAEFLVAKHHRLVAAEEQRGDDIEFGHPGGAVAPGLSLPSARSAPC